LGINELSEGYLNNGEALVANVGNIYSLAAAFSIDPGFVLDWLNAIRSQIPGALSGSLGFYDSVISDTEIGKKHFAIDQATIVLALTNSGGDDFDLFMRNRGLDDDFRSLYRSVNMQLPLVTQAMPVPPTFPNSTYTVFNNIASESGSVGDPVTQEYGTHVQYANRLADGTHSWVLESSYDASGGILKFDYSVITTPQVVQIVLKDASGVVLGTFSVTLDASAGIHTANIVIPATALFQNVARVELLVEPSQTGVQTADFYIHQLQFRR
jgi:hypothetical protein